MCHYLRNQNNIVRVGCEFFGSDVYNFARGELRRFRKSIPLPYITNLKIWKIYTLIYFLLCHIIIKVHPKRCKSIFAVKTQSAIASENISTIYLFRETLLVNKI